MNRMQRRAYEREAMGDASVVYGRRRVIDCSAEELFKELVNDAVGSLPTPPQRFMPAIIRIAGVWRWKPEQVFKHLTATVADKRGDSRMPGTPVGYRAGTTDTPLG